ncbi:MAG: hypothetical protein ABR968_14385 [Bacteroidales bacterium]|jgi:hypothetical protein
MKTRLLKFVLPLGMGLALLTITLLGIVSTTLTSCKKDCGCPAGYPLCCSGSGGKCCPAGQAYLCDGLCYSSPCPATTATVETCQ